MPLLGTRPSGTYRIYWITSFRAFSNETEDNGAGAYPGFSNITGYFFLLSQLLEEALVSFLEFFSVGKIEKKKSCDDVIYGVLVRGSARGRMEWKSSEVVRGFTINRQQLGRKRFFFEERSSANNCRVPMITRESDWIPFKNRALTYFFTFIMSLSRWIELQGCEYIYALSGAESRTG